MKKLQCHQARQLDLVDYLSTLGYEPKRISHHDYWYHSPFRHERTPSFKVHRGMNVWYDHGMGVGGDLIDFATRYFNCSVSELLARLSDQTAILSSAPVPPTPKKQEAPASKIQVVSVQSLADRSLVDYIQTRRVNLTIARQYCQEIDFILYGKTYTTIGFPNDRGGYELRSANFKGSSSPKDLSHIRLHQQNVNVFEGFFDFLSYQTLHPGRPTANALVLNSLAFFHRALPILEQHFQVNLYLDQDSSGRKQAAEAVHSNPEKYVDQSHLYQGHKDLNDWLIQQQINPYQSRKPPSHSR